MKLKYEELKVLVRQPEGSVAETEEYNMLIALKRMVSKLGAERVNELLNDYIESVRLNEKEKKDYLERMEDKKYAALAELEEKFKRSLE
jgi:hypothetical protein